MKNNIFQQYFSNQSKEWNRFILFHQFNQQGIKNNCQVQSILMQCQPIQNHSNGNKLNQQKIRQKMLSSNHFKAKPQIRQTYGLKNSSAQCLVKGKYFDTWTSRQIKINLQENTLDIITLQTQKKKSFVLDQVTFTKDQSGECIQLKIPNHRSYDIKNNRNLQQLVKDLDIYKYFKRIGEMGEQSRTPRPQKINYFLAAKHNLYTQDSTLSVSENKPKRSPSDYKRYSSFFKTQDWQRDKNGGLLLINKQKKRIIPQMIGYTARKAIKSGSFIHVNFPAFALKPETVLQTYCRCLGAAPVILSNVDKNPISRIKAFNAVILTMSIMFNDIQKAFNPALGQTFQGQIGGNPVYAEQISTRPNLTSFLLVGEQEQYRIYGTLELNAVISLNEAVGVFNGQVTLQFKDGGTVIGAMPKGTMSGILFGDIKFGPSGAVYSYDPHNQIVSSYEVVKRDVMRGYIGKLKQSSYSKFQSFLDTKKYSDFRAFQEKDFVDNYSKLEAVWTSHIQYDGKLYFDYNDNSSLPIELTQNLSNLSQKETLLPSDSSFRKDVKLRKLNSMKQSQKQNDFIDQQQERMANLRQMGRSSQRIYNY